MEPGELEKDSWCLRWNPENSTSSRVEARISTSTSRCRLPPASSQIRCSCFGWHRALWSTDLFWCTSSPAVRWPQNQAVVCLSSFVPGLRLFSYNNCNCQSLAVTTSLNLSTILSGDSNGYVAFSHSQIYDPNITKRWPNGLGDTAWYLFRGNFVASRAYIWTKATKSQPGWRPRARWTEKLVIEFDNFEESVATLFIDWYQSFAPGSFWMLTVP